MKRTGISWASALVRVFFLMLLLVRVGHSCFVTFPALLACSLNCYSPAFIWVAGKVLVDLVFVGLVWARFDRIWVAPVTFFWLSIQTIVSVEGNSVTIEGLKTIALIFPFILLAGLLVGKIFNWSGIRGRILIICLASACLPMFYLSLALIQQTRLLVENAFFPMARGMIELDLKRLNTAVLERANPDLLALFGVPGISTDTTQIPIFPEAVYWERAASLAIPLESVRLIAPTNENEVVNLDFADIQLETLLEILRKKFQISYDLRSQHAADKNITLTAKELTLDQVLKQLQEIPDLSIHWENGNLVVNSKVDPGNSSLRVAISAGGNARNFGFTDFVKQFSKNDNRLVSSVILHAPGTHTLEIRVPERENGSIIRGLILKIDMRKWVKRFIDRELNTREYLIRCCFPVTLENVTKYFEGFEVPGPDGKMNKFDPASLGFPFGDAQSHAGTIYKMKDVSLFLDGDPGLLDYSGLRDLKVHSPRLADYVLECWNLPFCEAPIFVSIATDHVWEALFRNQAKSLIYCFLAVLLAAFMSFVYSDRMSRPIQEITTAAGEICDGKLEVRIPEQVGEGEIEKLAFSLDLMAQRLTGRINLANQQLLAEKSRFETLIESTWEGICLLDSKGCLLYANHAGRQLLGSMKEKDDFFRALNAVGTEFQPPLSDSWNTGVEEFKCIFQLPCGSQGNRKILALYIRACSISGTKEGVSLESGYIAVLRDITVEKEIDRMKSDFVSQVSHELRTPLTSIKAYTEMLLDEEVEDPESRREYLKITFDEAERLTRLINDLLDIARIESGRRPLKLTEIDMSALTRDIAEVMKAQIEKAKQKLGVHIPSDQILLIGDADLLKQAGLNLLSNASKYTKPGGTIDLALEKRLDGKIVWKFSDTGVGLSAKEKDKLFDKFFRSDSDFVREAGGTGLGLTLVKNIIDLHAGEIIVDSVFEKGSTFTVVLPSGKIA